MNRIMNDTTEKTVKLSARLAAVASFVEPGSRVADVGTDHGYIPIYLVRTGIAQRALAMDVRPGPLERARAHVEQLEPGCRERIEIRLSDGLKALKPEEADTVVIAGMGGELIIRILEQGRHMWDSVRRLILSPQSELQKVRHFLSQEGFCILRETMVKDEGKYYTVMEAGRGTMEYGNEAQYLYGACLIREKHPVLREYLQKEKNRVEAILAHVTAPEGPATRGQEAARRSLTEELQWIEEALDEMQ